MNWITIKLMQYQLKKVQRQQDKEEYDLVARAYNECIKTYKNTIMFLKANSK
jgi:hypothetical protein